MYHVIFVQLFVNYKLSSLIVNHLYYIEYNIYLMNFQRKLLIPYDANNKSVLNL